MPYSPHQFAYNPHDTVDGPYSDSGTGMDSIPATVNAWEPPTLDYIVQPGDNLASVTKNIYGANTAQNRQRLRQYNPDLTPGSTITVTQM